MASERRIERLNKVISHAVAEILAADVAFEDKALVTVTKVETHKNMSRAIVYFTVLPLTKDKEMKNFLDENIYEIQQNWNKKLPIRPVPKLIFKIDKGQEEAEKVYDLLGKVNGGKKKKG